MFTLETTRPKLEQRIFEMFYSFRNYFGVTKIHCNSRVHSNTLISWTWHNPNNHQETITLGVFYSMIRDNECKITSVKIMLGRWETYQETRQWMLGHMCAKKLLKIISTFPEITFRTKINEYIKAKYHNDKNGGWHTIFEETVSAKNVKSILDCQLQGVGKNLHLTFSGEFFKKIENEVLSMEMKTV